MIDWYWYDVVCCTRALLPCARQSHDSRLPTTRPLTPRFGLLPCRLQRHVCRLQRPDSVGFVFLPHQQALREGRCGAWCVVCCMCPLDWPGSLWELRAPSRQCPLPQVTRPTPGAQFLQVVQVVPLPTSPLSSPSCPYTPPHLVTHAHTPTTLALLAPHSHALCPPHTHTHNPTHARVHVHSMPPRLQVFCVSAIFYFLGSLRDCGCFSRIPLPGCLSYDAASASELPASGATRAADPPLVPAPAGPGPQAKACEPV